MAVNEPVLLMGFNRPELMARVINRLRETEVARLYVAVDGPRRDRSGEAERVAACRDLVAGIDWHCDVRTLFQDENLGCGRGVTTALGWFFAEVERGIILEDDILPDPTFFGFCSELLDRYENDDRVFAVSGCNVVPRSRMTRPNDAYRFSQIPVVWGWATWRRSWAQHRLDITGWRRRLPISRLLQRVGYSPASALFWGSEFELTARGDVDTWDWQLTQAAMTSGQLTATTNVNLVANIGFGADATHTVGEGPALAPPRPAHLPTAPVPVVADRLADQWATRHHFGGSVLTSLDRIRQYVMSGRERAAPWA
jgi:hypothetical protein